MKGLFAAIIVLVFPCAACLAFDDGDFQYWNTVGISWKLAHQLLLRLEQEFRYGDDAGNPYYRHTDIGLTYLGLSDWLELGISYRQIFEERSNAWKYENQPHLNAKVKFSLRNFAFSDNNRFEYRDREDADNFWRYRNKLNVKFPLQLTKFQIQPFLADEFFVDFDKQELNQNRFYSGFSFKIIKNLTGELYHLWPRSKSSSGKWSDYSVVGSKLAVSF